MGDSTLHQLQTMRERMAQLVRACPSTAAARKLEEALAALADAESLYMGERRERSQSLRARRRAALPLAADRRLGEVRRQGR
jgi:hypothetical protein